MITKLFTIRGVVFMLGAVIMGAVITITMLLKIKPAQSMPDDSTIAYITAELDRRSAGDCVLEPIKDGWKCTDKEGKVYKVKAR